MFSSAFLQLKITVRIGRYIQRFKDYLKQLFPYRLRNRISLGVEMFSMLMSVVVVGAVIIDYGFELNNIEMSYISDIYIFAWWVYLMLFTIRLIVGKFRVERNRLFLTVVAGILLYLSALPKIITLNVDCQWLEWLWNILENRYYLIVLLIVFSIMEISGGIVNFISKNTNPALLLVMSFVVMIFLGTILLLVPRSTVDGVVLPVVDAIFVATSAVCVTGLTPVDVATTFTVEGQFIIMMLIQVGGLGVMTFTSFFALFFMGKTGFYNQYTLKDMISGTDNTASLFSTLLYILGFTLVIEGLGAFFIWLSIRGTMNMPFYHEISFALFHAVSAFCNAGFSTMTGNLGNGLVFGVSNPFYIIISILVILGGIGFPILVNLRNILVYQIKRLWRKYVVKASHQAHYHHLMSINTRIVLITSGALILIGSVVFALLEWNGAFAGMSVWEKITQSFFHAVVPRTAGFNSVDLTHLGFLSIILYIFLMWIGGGSQSTAGGIKVNVLAVAWGGFVATIRGRSRVVLFNREIADDSVRRASAVIFGSILTIMFAFVVLVVMEPNISPLSLLFETVSAFCTVGSSLNVTPLLGGDSKLLLSLVMFAGRVGLIYLLSSMMRPDGDKKYRLPKENIIIN